MTSVRHPPLTEGQKDMVELLWFNGNGLMSIASMTNIPSGTLKPFLDTLPECPDRAARIDEKRKRNGYRPHWPARKTYLLEEDRVNRLYQGSRYDDFENPDAKAIKPTKNLDTVEAYVERGRAIGLEITDGSRSGLWCVGAAVDIPLRRLIKLINNQLIRQGLSPLPNPDGDSLNDRSQQASASRMLANYQELGIHG